MTLTGNVDPYIERMTAEAAAKRVKGVKGIALEIEVVPFGSNKVTDEDIVQRCLNILKWNTTIPNGALQVKVSKGWVTVEGSTDSERCGGKRDQAFGWRCRHHQLDHHHP